MSARILTQIVGNTVAQWDEGSPLRWTLQDRALKSGRTKDPIICDLSVFEGRYDRCFLLALKEILILSRHRIQLITIKSHVDVLRSLLELVRNKGMRSGACIKKFDSNFLVALNAVLDEIPRTYLRYLKSFFNKHKSDDRIFEKGLHSGDFPGTKLKRGHHGQRIYMILAKALPRSTLVHVLDVVEAAFEEDRIDIARYSLTRLALNIFCRPESYRQLTLADLRIDKDPQSGVVTYFLFVLPAKTGLHNPTKTPVRLHPEVGRILAMQRQAVVEKYGHLAPLLDGTDQRDYGKLALFPAERLTHDRSTWVCKHAARNWGMVTSSTFMGTYLRRIVKIVATKLSFTGLRHTVGTQMAQMGYSAHSIQAVLRHGTISVCRAYVDIVFQGLIDKLSDSLEPAFEKHFPVFEFFVNSADPFSEERRIDSADLEDGRVETTGVCGLRVACSYAPISCYACPRFIPCYDADHTINLKIVDREIGGAQKRGLAMQHEVRRWETIRQHILTVIAACDAKLRNLESDSLIMRGDSP